MLNMQNSLLKIYKYLPQLRHQEAFEAWIFQICTNEIRHYFRTNQKRLAYQKANKVPELTIQMKNRYTLYQAESTYDQPDQMMIKKSIIHLIETEISLLPLHHYTILSLWLGGQKISQIQETLGLSAPAVKARMRRARQFLKLDDFRFFLIILITSGSFLPVI